MLKLILQYVLALLMVSAAVLHWLIPAPFVKIVPNFLPYPLALVYVSGIAEIVLGVGLLVPSLRLMAAWGLILLFVAVFPANINMAVNQIQIDGLPDSDLLRWGRLPLQAVLIAWAWWYTRP